MEMGKKHEKTYFIYNAKYDMYKILFLKYQLYKYIV